MLLKVACAKCRQDLVRYAAAGGKQLECMECDSLEFFAYHQAVEEVETVRKRLKELKEEDFNPESFDDIINRLGEDFESIFK